MKCNKSTSTSKSSGGILSIRPWSGVHQRFEIFSGRTAPSVHKIQVVYQSQLIIANCVEKGLQKVAFLLIVTTSRFCNMNMSQTYSNNR